MIRDISIEGLLQIDKPVFIDVRSEGEYSEATIPGAINLPLLNNNERAEIGTIYTKISPTLAREQGLKIISPKLPELVKKAGELSQNGPLVLFCWRGGMRSKSLAAILDLMGIQVYRLQGGYKAYRHHINSFFEGAFPSKVVVLRGNTGIGKTEILQRLKQDGYPAIDLEGLANNRGSVFGSLGLGPSPSQKDFEAHLYEDLNRLKGFSYIVVECESKRIGRVSLPANLFAAMQNGVQVLLYDTIENRVNRLIKEYTAIENALPQIEEALERLRKTLGNKKVDEYRLLLAENDLTEFTVKMLDYYDELYAYPNSASAEYSFSLCNENPAEAVKELEQYLDECVAESSETTLSGVRDSAK